MEFVPPVMMMPGPESIYTPVQKSGATSDLKPPFLPRRCVGGLDVSAIDADRAQWIARWQTKFIESRLAGQPMVGLLVEASTDSRHVPLPRRNASGLFQWQHRAQDAD
jgi:hypothetical protein